MSLGNMKVSEPYSNGFEFDQFKKDLFRIWSSANKYQRRHKIWLQATNVKIQETTTKLTISVRIDRITNYKNTSIVLLQDTTNITRELGRKECTCKNITLGRKEMCYYQSS